MVRDVYRPNRFTPMIIKQKHNYIKHIDKKKIIIAIIICVILIIGWIILKKPSVTLIGDKIEKVAYKSEFIDSGVKVNYHGQDITNKVIASNNIDTNKLGEYKIEYKIPYMFGTYTYTRKALVVDNMPPEITLEAGEECKVSIGKEYEEPGYKAVDNYDGEITDKVEVSKEQISDDEIHVHYKVTDSSGNIQEKTRKVVFVDNVKPVIELNGSGTIVLNIGEEYKEQGAKAKDEKDGELTEKIEISGNVNTNQEGTYTVTYKVKDNSDNEAIATREVLVGTIGKAAMNVGAPGVVHLTFDDGPSSSSTPRILDILKEKGVKATFFILNFGEETAHLVKRVVEEGHSIAIHSKSHEYSVCYASADAYLSGIEEMKDKIKNTTGVETKLIRFPGGSSNTVSRKYSEGVMSTLVRETLQRGYRYYDWNVASGDSGGVNTPEGVYDNVTNGLKPTRSNIVLMHDFSGNNKTIEALPGIIDFAINNGYTFDKITDKTPMVTQNVQN